MATGPRIERYESRVDTPIKAIEGGAAPIIPRSPDITTGLNMFAEAFGNIAKAQEQSNVANAQAQLASLEPEAQLAFRNKFNEVKNTWAPGAEPMADQMNKFIQDYTDTATKSVTNPRAREMILKRSNELRTNYMLQGADAQVGAEVEYRTGQYTQSYQTVADLSVTDPTKFGLEIAKLNATVMADEQIPVAKRQELVQKNARDAANQVAKVQAESNPDQVLALTGSMLGIKEPVLRTTGGKVDINEAIIRNESGGRMYGNAGEVLRGPAITTADGKTIHAYGKYQLLESTARDQAAKLGIPWSPEVFLRGRTGDASKDAETAAYHDQLGQAYIADQNRQFGGNPILIAAAHNMGPEATRGWAEGRPYQTQSGKWWYPKQPMDMSAMPEETRNYIGKLGVVEEQAPAAPTQGIAAEYAVPFQLLDGPQLLAARNAAQSRLAEINRQNEAKFAVDRDLFKQRIQDLETAGKEGDPFELPGFDEMATFLGPAQAILKTRQLQGYQNMARALKSLPSLSNAELSAAANMPNPDGTEDRENRQFMTDTIRAQADKLIALRKSDPGLAAQDAPGVQAAYSAWQQAGQALREAGKSATQEMVDARDASQQHYIATSFSQQRAWGVVEPKLPNDVLAGLTDGFAYNLANGNVPQAVRVFSDLPKQLGSYEAINQVGEKGGDLAWFSMEGVPPTVISQLNQAKGLKADEVGKFLPNGVKTADINREVQKAFGPLLQSLNANSIDQAASDPGTAGRYARNGYSLAAQYLIGGQASSAKEAANMAYKALYADRETIKNGLRIPNNFDADKVSAGLGQQIARLTPGEMFVAQASPGLTEADTRARILRTVRENGQWITDEQGTGAYLMAGGKPVMGKDGRPIHRTYDQAVKETKTWQPTQADLLEQYRATTRGFR